MIIKRSLVVSILSKTLINIAKKKLYIRRLTGHHYHCDDTKLFYIKTETMHIDLFSQSQRSITC